ncbi:MAG: hypothetical protein DSY33_02490 [Archaeoglobus sp.]|nr:MAG: hypothetical protein DSY33_02490 [Archaeoglobus sp.]
MKVKKDITDFVTEKLKEQFGIDEPELRFYEGGKGKIYTYKYKLPEFLKKYLVQSGIYFGRIEKDGVRLSIDGSSLVGKKADACRVELNDVEAINWMSGRDIKKDSKTKCCYILLKWRSFFVGCGKLFRENEELKIKNFVPKNRRVR